MHVCSPHAFDQRQAACCHPQCTAHSTGQPHEAVLAAKRCLSMGQLFCAVQNDYDELFNLLDWAVPGGLGDRKQFHLYYEGPIKMAQKKDVNEAALGKVCCLCLLCFSSAMEATASE